MASHTVNATRRRMIDLALAAEPADFVTGGGPGRQRRPVKGATEEEATTPVQANQRCSGRAGSDEYWVRMKISG